MGLPGEGRGGTEREEMSWVGTGWERMVQGVMGHEDELGQDGSRLLSALPVSHHVPGASCEAHV